MVELVSWGGSCGFHEFPRFPVLLGQALVAHHQAAKETFLLEGHQHLFPHHFVPFINRASVGDIPAIFFGQRPARHAHSRMKLIIVVDSTGVRRVEVGLNHHPHVLLVVGKVHMLNLANVGKANIVGVGRPIALHLREIKRHLGHAPGIPPTLDQRFHPGRVNPAITTIAGSLAPDGTTNPVGNDRSDLAIEKLGRPTPHACNSGKVRAAGHLAPCLSNLAGLLLPCLQVLIVALEGGTALLGQGIRIENKIGVFF